MSRSFFLPGLVVCLMAAGHAQAEQRLTLEDVTQRVLQQHPRLAAATARETAAAGRAYQAAAWANPEVSFTLEDFAGDTGLRAREGSATWALSQPFSLPGKRRARRDVADADRQLATLSVQEQRLAIIRLAREASVELAAADTRRRHAMQARALAQRLHDAVAARVEAGKVSPVELSRAGVSLAAAERAERLATRQHELAQSRLQSLWGGAGEVISLPEVLELPDSLPLAPALADTVPALQRLLAEREKQQAAVREASRNGLPDITLSAGLKREAVTRDESLQLGIAVPLPLFDRNQGERRAARAELVAVEADLASARQELAQETARLEMEREASFREVQQLHAMLAVTEKAANALQEGYAAGKFSLMDLLDGQRALVDAQEADLAAHVAFHRSDAALDELLGRDPFVSPTTLYTNGH